MADQVKPSKNQSAVPLLLPKAEDYLGQWLAILQEHYPGDANEMTALGAAAYRIALNDLTPPQLDRAFTATLRHHARGFRPSAGEIRGYLRESYENELPPSRPSLPEPELSAAERQEILRKIKEGAAKLGNTVAPTDRPESTIEITDEMRARHAEKTAEALRKAGKA